MIVAASSTVVIKVTAVASEIAVLTVPAAAGLVSAKTEVAKLRKDFLWTLCARSPLGALCGASVQNP